MSIKLRYALGLLFLVGFASTVNLVRGDEGEAEAQVETEGGFGDDDYEIEDLRAHLVVRKHVAEDTIVEGNELTVSVTIYNLGQSTAEDINVEDSFPKKKFTLKDGQTTFKVGKISPGSEETFQYTLLPTTTGPSSFKAAAVTYIAGGASTGKTKTRSNVASALVLTTNDYIIRSVLVAGSYATLGILQHAHQWQRVGIFIAVAIVVIGGNKIWTSFSEMRSTQRRKKALQDLKME